MAEDSPEQGQLGVAATDESGAGGCWDVQWACGRRSTSKKVDSLTYVNANGSACLCTTTARKNQRTEAQGLLFFIYKKTHTNADPS